MVILDQGEKWCNWILLTKKSICNEIIPTINVITNKGLYSTNVVIIDNGL